MIFGHHINRYYIKYWYLFLLGLAALVVVDFVQLNIPVNISLVLDHLSNGTMSDEILNNFLRNMITILITMVICRFTWRITILGMSVRIEDDLRRKMFSHMETLDQTYFNVHKTGTQMALYTNDLQVIKACFGDGTVMLVDSLLLGGLAIFRMFQLDWFLALIAIVPVLILALFGGLIGKYMELKWQVRQEAYDKMSEFTQENFSGISVIKAYVKEQKELIAFSKVNKENEERNLNFIRYSTIVNISIGFIISIVLVIIIGYGSYLVKESALLDEPTFTIGSLNNYIYYFIALIWPMIALANIINLRSQGKSSLKRISALLNEKPKVFDSSDVLDVEEIKTSIEFKNLTFTYPDGTNPVLNNVSFRIEEGETVGIIGRTGSGKTTLVDLLTRVYNVDNDTIYIDEYDIMKLPLEQVRSLISYVPQDNFLFGDTIKNNIGFGLTNISEEEAKQYAILAGVAKDIEEFPDGYNTIMGERGVTLSGGQKQRVSIARALAKESKILILDDSVSAVDTKTESMILTNLQKYHHNKTVLIIAHRISTVQNLDKIIIMDDGKVVAVGQHKDLYENVELYREMVDLQKLEDISIGGIKHE